MSNKSEHPLGLTVRELEVLTLISRGMTDKEIARNLDISPYTVSNHVRNMSRKAGGVRRCVLAVGLAMHSIPLLAGMSVTLAV